MIRRAITVTVLFALAALGAEAGVAAAAAPRAAARSSAPAAASAPAQRGDTSPAPESTPPGASQHPGMSPMPRPEETMPPERPHVESELDCKNCHVSKHQGVVRMYLGRGGRGAKPVPSHMSQLRLECIACHVAEKEPEATAAIVGQTYRPSEKACIGCHGERYRGMVGQWSGTLGKMRAIVGSRVTAARAALAASPKHPKAGQARKLLADTEFNVRFVELGRGVHNVFYAADLLRLANGWAGDAMRALGKTPAKVDDALVRGGYCAVLCHEPIGVKTPDVANYGTKRFPHARHAKELGAACTTCHSADVHKAFTATPATCTGCHHGPQNERCEGCHKDESAFYRGRVKAAQPIAPNLMADAVACAGCHDWSTRQTRAAIAQKCVACHEPTVMPLATEWTAGFDADMKKTAAAVGAAEAAIRRARKSGRRVADAEALVREAKDSLAIVRSAKPAHNPLAADGLLTAARKKAEEARAKATGR
ncbi:MAG: hypothetical protein HYU51_06325 [Candidatus Rokubacteria bacterium]|nr:hypothetical protein [Candidatus Rokubacteria bacterium]